MTWLAGAARREVTCWEPGMHLFGWGIPTNVSHDVATPMFARALVVEADATPLAIVVVDIGVITYTLRRHVLLALRERHPTCPIRDEHLLLSATHTHSGPSGYSEYLLYGFSGPGLSRHVVTTYANGIADALADAWNTREAASLRVVADDLPRTVPIAFNRSLTPYHQNAEMEGRSEESAEEATSRTMTLLRATRRSDDSPIGVVAWFATHATSIHSDNTKVHGDHRGLAARDFEAQLQTEFGRDVVAMFPQEAAGDVTPNFRWDPKRKLVVGAKETDEESAQFVADALRTFAARLYRRADTVDELSPVVSGTLQYVQMPGFTYDVSADATNTTSERVSLADAVMGLGFMEGTREGPGPLHAIRGLNRRITESMRPTGRFAGREFVKGQANKIPFLETGRGRRGRAFGFISLKNPPPLTFLDQTVATYIYYLRSDALDDHAWSPTVLPFQVLRIGPLLLATVPGEPTTMVGRRLRATLRAATQCGSSNRMSHRMDTKGPSAVPSWSAGGADHVVIAGYANDYAAYVTTKEEYFAQWYEGASTMFGPHTFGAMQYILRDLTQHVWEGTPLAISSASPPVFDPALFEKRDYQRHHRLIK